MLRYLLGIALLAVFGCAPAASSSSPSPVAEVAQAAVGQVAPTPPAKDQDGAPVDFAALYAQGPVLVYFYPKADTPGCTAQSCSLRDAYQKLSDAGLTVIGVSTDDQATQKAFQEKHQLPFTLVSDPQAAVLKAFGVGQRLGMARREAFLIKDGAVVWHDDSASTEKQADDVLEQLATWEAPAQP